MGVNALVFDCDGVLADTERDGHRVAFNQMFREFGIPIEWSEDTYAEKIKIGGGKERMAAELTPDFVRSNGLPTDPDGQAAEVARWHRRKTEIYTAMVAGGRLPPRPGIRRVIMEAQDAGWALAVASTSAEPSVRAILEHAVGPERASRFDVLLAGDVVPKKKPAPDIYLLALERLAAQPAEVLVVEDSRNGLLAATGAGLRCVMTVNGYTEHEDASEAVLVVSSLGDPDGERTRVIANRSPAEIGDYVTLADLARCLEPTIDLARPATTEHHRGGLHGSTSGG
jgi:HAD superfamily hydrolase (TIGR01509 family)